MIFKTGGQESPQLLSLLAQVIHKAYRSEATCLTNGDLSHPHRLQNRCRRTLLDSVASLLSTIQLPKRWAANLSYIKTVLRSIYALLACFTMSFVAFGVIRCPACRCNYVLRRIRIPSFANVAKAPTKCFSCWVLAGVTPLDPQFVPCPIGFFATSCR